VTAAAMRLRRPAPAPASVAWRSPAFTSTTAWSNRNVQGSLLSQRLRPREGEGGPEPQTTITACDVDKKEAVEKGIEAARSLAERALTALAREFPLSFEASALRANFGSLSSDQTKTITGRYEHVRDTLSSKTITCTRCKAKKKGEHTCAEGAVSGSKILICPPFGTTACPAGPTMLHEAAHNAGAANDVKPGTSGYPPADSEDNAYSYEQFPVDVLKGPPTFELKKGKPKEPVP
jgi:hypothetical protein